MWLHIKVNYMRLYLLTFLGWGGAYGGLPSIMTSSPSLVAAVQVDSSYSQFMDCKISTIVFALN